MQDHPKLGLRRMQNITEAFENNLKSFCKLKIQSFLSKLRSFYEIVEFSVLSCSFDARKILKKLKIVLIFWLENCQNWWRFTLREVYFSIYGWFLLFTSNSSATKSVAGHTEAKVAINFNEITDHTSKAWIVNVFRGVDDDSVFLRHSLPRSPEFCCWRWTARTFKNRLT